MSDGGPWQPPRPDAGPPAAAGPAPAGGSFSPPGGPAATPLELPEEHGAAPAGRSRGAIIGAAIGVVAIIGAGVFAITRFTGDAAAGGADSPEDAGLGLLQAIEDEDVLAMADLLLPGERDTLREPATDLVTELQRLEVLSDDASLSSISGVDITVEDGSVEAEPTNVDDIVNLTISASVAGSIDGEALPIGQWIRDETDTDFSDLDAEATEPEPGEFQVTAVEQDGRWYLSVFYTVAENARRTAGEGQDIPVEGVAPTGGDSPEAAMDALLDSVEQLDVEGMIASLNPDEFEALQRYAPLFLDDARAAVGDVDAQIEIGDRAYSVSGSGDSRSVAVEGFTVDISAEGETVHGELRDGCFVVSAGGETTDTCEVAGEVPDLSEVLDDPQPVEDLIDSVRETFADYESPGFIVSQVDGTWYVSPLATMSENVLAVVRALTREEIEDLQTQVSDAVDVLGDLTVDLQQDFPDLDDFERPGDDEAVLTPTTEAGDAETDDGSIPADPAEPCYGEADAETATACFQALVDSGDIDAVAVPWFLRFPDCGVAEIGWSGEYYGLPDDEFIAVVDEANTCFQDLLTSGEAEEFDLPIEMLHPECLEGRNPYTITDEDQLAAFNECAFG